MKKKYKIIINKNALCHFTLEEKKHLVVTSKILSPDYGTIGHLLRLIYTNTIYNPVVNLSQLQVNLLYNNQIIIVHDLIPLLFPRYHRKQYYFFKYLLPLGLKKAKLIITVSKHTKNLILKYYNLDESKIIVNYNGIEFPKRNKSVKKENFILFVGRDTPMKNINNLVKAFNEINKKYRFLKLYLVGVNRIFPNKNIKSLGYVDDKTLDRLYRKALVFILPSLYEGFGYPVVEAMSRGTACIVSNVSALPEIAGDAALFVNPYSPKDIYNKIEILLKYKTYRKELENKGIKRSRKFNIKSTMKNYSNILETFLI